MNWLKYAIHDDTQIKGFFGEYIFLSNFYLCKIEFNGMVFPSVENAYMASKSIKIEHQKRYLYIQPAHAKKLGALLTIREDWYEVKLGFMYEFNLQKYTNHPELKKLLLDTGSKYLEETNSWNDRFWGVFNGIGKNNLGKILMRIRSELQV